MNLTGKIALVTGASRGIGRQIALTLAGYGATVIVNYNGSAAKAEEVVNEITANGGMAESMQCSVSDFEKSKEMIRWDRKEIRPSRYSCEQRRNHKRQPDHENVRGRF